MSTATYAQLTAEIASNWPSGNPTTLTAASARRYLQDQIDSLNVAASTTSTVNLSTYQPFVNTASVAAAAVLLQVYDGTQGVTWGQLNSTAHTISLIASGSIAASGALSVGSAISATAGITSGSGGGVSGTLTLNGSTSGNIQIASGGTGSVNITATGGQGFNIDDGTNGIMFNVQNAGTSSIANQFVVKAASAGSALQLVANGSDTNININVTPKGTGFVSLNNTAIASTATQVIQMSTTAGFGIYFGNASPPTVSTAASGSLYISTTGSSSSTRMYVSNSVQSWIAVTTAS